MVPTPPKVFPSATVGVEATLLVVHRLKGLRAVEATHVEDGRGAASASRGAAAGRSKRRLAAAAALTSEAVVSYVGFPETPHGPSPSFEAVVGPSPPGVRTLKTLRARILKGGSLALYKVVGGTFSTHPTFEMDAGTHLGRDRRPGQNHSATESEKPGASKTKSNMYANLGLVFEMKRQT